MAAPGSGSTATAQRVVVESADLTPGVRLVAASDQELPDEHARELLRYSPDFIIFPDANNAEPPIRKDREDYHPRPVQAYLDRAHPYVATPSGWTAGLYALAVSGSMVVGATCLLILSLLPPANIAVPLIVGLLASVVALLAADFLTPISMRGIRKRIDVGETTDRLGIRRERISLPFTEDRLASRAWADYRANVVNNARYPRSSYARAFESRGDLYLQYWQFYVFNDWHNRHEADWEVVVVRLVRTANDWRPFAAAYSSHLGGHWRLWGELEARDDTHPVVYVARGSHAQYFESRPEGYTATITQPFTLLDLRIRLTLQGDNLKDLIAGMPERGSATYELIVLPVSAEPKDWTPEQRSERWWLAFDGAWGGRGAIAGPRGQASSKWNDPWTWIDSDVTRDSGYWNALSVDGD